MLLQFKIFVRRWGKQKLLSLISILSLIIGLTCSIILISFVVEEYRIANSFSDKKQTYQVLLTNNLHKEQNLKTELIAPNISHLIQENIPEIDQLCIIHSENYSTIEDEKEILQKNAFQVSPEFADIFNPKMLSGNLKSTLSNQNEVAVTGSFAIKKFNKENPIGEKLLIKNDKIIESAHGAYQKNFRETYTITSVIDDSKKNIFSFEILLPFQGNTFLNLRNYYGMFASFVTLDNSIDVTSVENKINSLDFMKEHKRLIHLQPVSNIYLADSKIESRFMHSRNKMLLYIAICISITLLLIACFNYMNVNMTLHIRRLRTTAQQVLFGAKKTHIFLQLFQENLVIVIIAFIISIGLIPLILPIFNDFMLTELRFWDLLNSKNLMFIGFILLFMSFIPSVYVFFKLKKNSLTDTLKNNSHNKSKLIAWIIIMQFAISFGLITFMNILNKQINYIIYYNPESDNILEVSVSEGYDDIYWNNFDEILLQSPYVLDHTYFDILYQGYQRGTYSSEIDDNFLNFYNLRLLEGNYLNKESRQKNEILVNQTFVKKNNLINPVNSYFNLSGTNFLIKGVVEDFQITHFSLSNESLTMEYNNEKIKGGIFIKVYDNNVINKQYINNLWKKHAPEANPLRVETLKERLTEIHKEEYKMMQIVKVFSVISLLLSLLGLFGIARYSVELRTKEIALRKVNGSTTNEILIFLILRFLKWITIGCIIVLPISWYVCREWLSGFVYRVDLTMHSFVITYCMIVIIGIITVLAQSWVAARKNPIDTIKME